MSAADDRFNELLSQSYELDDGPSRVALLEDAVREADALGDLERGFEARMELIQAATFSGFHEKALVSFSWCLAQADKDPERFDEGSLLWQYKWVLDSVPAFPQVSRTQIASLQDDFERRLDRLGASPRPALYMRWSNAMRMGDWEETHCYVEKWQSAPRDQFADCTACERNKRVELFVRLKQDRQACDEAEPILQGKVGCAEVPHITLALVLRPLMRLAQFDDARRHHQHGYRLVCTNREFVGRIAEHLVYLVRVGDLKKAVQLFNTHLAWAVETANLDNRFLFYGASCLVLAALAAAKEKPGPLHVPQELPCHRDDAAYDPAELAAWFHAQAADLAARFDRRNGNDYYARQIQDACQLATGSSHQQS